MKTRGLTLLFIFFLSMILACGADNTVQSERENAFQKDIASSEEANTEEEPAAEMIAKEHEDNAEEAYSKGDYETALAEYDEALLTVSDDQTIREKRDRVLEEYLQTCIDDENLDAAKKIISDHEKEVSDVDFDGYIKRIADLERDLNFKNRYMAKIYKLMEEKDYAALKAEVTSPISDQIASAVSDNRVIYIPESTDGSGLGVGLYLFSLSDGSSNKYFYFGNYENGSRESNGMVFGCVGDEDDAYEVVDCVWSGDAPNGEFVWDKTEYLDGERVQYHTTGTLRNGLEDGEIEQHVVTPYFETTTHWTSKDGIAPDIYESITDATAKSSLKSWHDDGYAIVAYSVVRNGNTEYVWRVVCDPSERFGFWEYKYPQ